MDIDINKKMAPFHPYVEAFTLVWYLFKIMKKKTVVQDNRFQIQHQKHCRKWEYQVT
jgi:hypothetical protein